MTKLPFCMASSIQSKPNPQIKENDDLPSIKEIIRLQMMQQQQDREDVHYAC